MFGLCTEEKVNSAAKRPARPAEELASGKVTFDIDEDTNGGYHTTDLYSEEYYGADAADFDVEEVVELGKRKRYTSLVCCLFVVSVIKLNGLCRITLCYCGDNQRIVPSSYRSFCVCMDLVMMSTNRNVRRATPHLMTVPVVCYKNVFSVVNSCNVVPVASTDINLHHYILLR